MHSLNIYNQKRDFSKTDEPFGKKEKHYKKQIFCVQYHWARKKHYDFRMEVNGVLKSFAIPKGPSYFSEDKRLAVMVEDHPYSYSKFEGVIKSGYGKGSVMLWDSGYYEPIGNILDGLKKGEIKFILYGKRLKGRWTLIHYKEDKWLFIKEKDSYFFYQDTQEFNTSIKTGRTMEEIINGVVLKRKKVHEDIVITNPEKVIFPSPKVTKMDIVHYYENVTFRMLPFIQNRIFSVVRAPNGINGSCFYKKHFEYPSSGIGKVKISNQRGGREDYYYIKDKTGLIKEVQMNSFEFHIWPSFYNKNNRPNLMVFDLDPDEGLSLTKLREGVWDLKKILDELKLPSFLKTSGGKGYHVVVPFSFQSFKKLKEVARDIAKLMEKRWPEKYTTSIRKTMRKEKIFIDWLRNTKGATLVAPYSIRLKKRLSISMPIKWSELNRVRPDEINIEEAIKRLKRKDPWEHFFDFL